MAKYRYICTDCQHDWIVFHKPKEEITSCVNCESVSVSKDLSGFIIKTDNVIPTGFHVSEGIEENKQELKTFLQKRLDDDD